MTRLAGFFFFLSAHHIISPQRTTEGLSHTRLPDKVYCHKQKWKTIGRVWESKMTWLLGCVVLLLPFQARWLIKKPKTMKEGRTEDETKNGDGEAGERSVLLAQNCFCFSKVISLSSCATQLRMHLKRTSDFFRSQKDFPNGRIRLLTKSKEAYKVYYKIRTYRANLTPRRVNEAVIIIIVTYAGRHVCIRDHIW